MKLEGCRVQKFNNNNFKMVKWFLLITFGQNFNKNIKKYYKSLILVTKPVVYLLKIWKYNS